MKNVKTMTTFPGKDLYGKTAWFLQNAIYDVTRLMFRIFVSWQNKTDEELLRSSKPLLFAVAPHTSMLDLVLLPAALPRRLLPVRWVADRNIFTSRFKTFWLKLWGAVPVRVHRKGSIAAREVETIVTLLKRGSSVGIFPECCMVGGSFSQNHSALLKVCLNSLVPVVPVALVGSTSIRLSRLKDYKGKLKVYISAPLRRVKATDKDLGLILAEIMDKIIDEENDVLPSLVSSRRPDRR
jgi:1-acyl-sn-glycerol-3-phosphate acyltransferase